MSGHAAPRPVTVEDYHSDDGSPGLSDRKSCGADAGLRQAAVGTEGGPASDSGYSSHAAATAGSLDSSINIPTKPTNAANAANATPMNPPPPPAYDPDPAVSPTKRRSTPYVYTPSSRPRAKAHERPTAVRAETSADPRTRHHRPAHEPASRSCDCHKCIRPRSHRDSLSPLDAPWNLDLPPVDYPPVDYPPVDRRRSSYAEDPYLYTPSGRYTEEELRASAPVPRPRPSIPRARPMSYHTGIPTSYDPYYPDVYGAVPLDYGPPPSTSAYTNPPVATGSYLPHTMSLPPHPSYPMEYHPDAYIYERSRPSMPTRSATERRSSSRPVSMYGSPVIDYGYAPPTPYSPSSRRPSTRDSDDVPQHRSQRERDSQAMPPPAKPSRRPSVRQSRSANPARQIPRSATVPAPSDAGATVMAEAYGRSSHREPSSRQRSRSRRPSFPADSDERRSSRTYSDGPAKIQVESKSSRRQSTYYASPLPRSPEKTRNLERSAEEYQQARTRGVPMQQLTDDALRQQQKARRAATGSSSGSHSRASGSWDGSEVKARSGSGRAVSVPESDDGITMRFTPGTDVKLDFTGGMNGRRISLKPGQTGQQAELSIKSRKGYENRSTGTHSEYARSDRRREIEDGGRGTREGRSSNHARRASRTPRDRQTSY